MNPITVLDTISDCMHALKIPVPTEPICIYLGEIDFKEFNEDLKSYIHNDIIRKNGYTYKINNIGKQV